MDDFVDIWTRRLVAMAEGGVTEEEARELVAEIHQAAMDQHDREVAEREAEREE